MHIVDTSVDSIYKILIGWIYVSIKVSMGLTRQLSNGLKFNRQPSKTVIFLPSTVKNAEKFQQNISNLAFLSISADFHGLLAPED